MDRQLWFGDIFTGFIISMVVCSWIQEPLLPEQQQQEIQKQQCDIKNEDQNQEQFYQEEQQGYSTQIPTTMKSDLSSSTDYHVSKFFKLIHHFLSSSHIKFNFHIK